VWQENDDVTRDATQAGRGTAPGNDGDDQSPEPPPMSWWNRFTLRFFGPPQIGDAGEPMPVYDADPPCPHCGHLESEHQSFRTQDGKTLRRCPT
jgi:hypothetical protein